MVMGWSANAAPLATEGSRSYPGTRLGGSGPVHIQGHSRACAAGSRTDEDDACDVAAGLAQADFFECIVSERTGESMYVFKPDVAEMTLYLKVVLRNGCVVISFHEDQVSHEQDEQ